MDGGRPTGAGDVPRFKVVLLGEGRVGKTSLLVRYVEDSYLDGCAPTFRASYLEKNVEVPPADRGAPGGCVGGEAAATLPAARSALLSIWDTAGQERYHALGPIYYRDADGAVLVYDVTDAGTFRRVRNWARELRQMVGDSTKISLTIVGNKIDLLEEEWAVGEPEAVEYARSVGATHRYASAKDGTGVEDVFVGLTRRMLDGPKLKAQRDGQSQGLRPGGRRLVIAPPGSAAGGDPSPQRQGTCC